MLASDGTASALRGDSVPARARRVRGDGIAIARQGHASSLRDLLRAPAPQPWSRRTEESGQEVGATTSLAGPGVAGVGNKRHAMRALATLPEKGEFVTSQARFLGADAVSTARSLRKAPSFDPAAAGHARARAAELVPARAGRRTGAPPARAAARGRAVWDSGALRQAIQVEARSARSTKTLSPSPSASGFCSDAASGVATPKYSPGQLASAKKPWV